MTAQQEREAGDARRVLQMMRERLEYTSAFAKASHAARVLVWGEEPLRELTPGELDMVARFAAHNIVDAVRMFTPRSYWRAILNHDSLVWSWPLTAGPFVTGPMDPDKYAFVCNVAGALVPGGWCPPSFALDPRHGEFVDPNASGFGFFLPREADQLERIANAGVRYVQPRAWSMPSDVNVTMLQAYDAMKATRIPEAVAIAEWRDVERGPVPDPANIDALPLSFAERFITYPRAEGWRLPRKTGAVPSDEERAELGDIVTYTDGEVTRVDSVRLAARGRPRPGSFARAILADAGFAIAWRLQMQWNGLAVAHVLAERARVDLRQQREPRIALPATAIGRMPFDALAQHRALARSDLAPVEDLWWRIMWGGGARAAQLSLAFPAQLGPDLVREITREGGRDMLLAYLVLHRFANAQGCTGEFWWSWDQHKVGTPLLDMVKTGKAPDPELRARTIDAIRRLSDARILEATPTGGWRVVGKAPLVSIDGAENIDGQRAIRMTLNPELYRSARYDPSRRDSDPFAEFPESLLKLTREGDLNLAASIVFAARYKTEENCVVRLSLDMVRAATAPAEYRGRRQFTARDAHAACDRLVAHWPTATWKPWPAGDGVDFIPSRAMSDSYMYRVPRALPAARGYVPPTTGRELVEWRRVRGFTQASAAARLGVSVRTIKRVEKESSNDPLPPSFRKVRWEEHPAPEQPDAGPRRLGSGG